MKKMNLHKKLMIIIPLLLITMILPVQSGPAAAAIAAAGCCASLYWLAPIGIPVCSLDAYSCPPVHPPFPYHAPCALLSGVACLAPTL